MRRFETVIVVVGLAVLCLGVLYLAGCGSSTGRELSQVGQSHPPADSGTPPSDTGALPPGIGGGEGGGTPNPPPNGGGGGGGGTGGPPGPPSF